MPLQQAHSPVVRARRGEKRPFAAHDPVNAALDLLERRRLAPMELRILLAVRDRERAESELAASLGREVMVVRQSAGALYARGFLHWRYLHEGNDAAFSLTPAGQLVLRPLMSAVADAELANVG